LLPASTVVTPGALPPGTLLLLVLYGAGLGVLLLAAPFSGGSSADGAMLLLLLPLSPDPVDALLPGSGV